MATFYEAMVQNNRVSPFLLRQPGVTGVGVGYADPDNPSHGAALIVYTQKAIATSQIRSMTGKLTGSKLPVRLITAGPFKPHGSQVKSRKLMRYAAAPAKRVNISFFRRRIRPVPGGVSIGRFAGNLGITGTGGLIVIRSGQLFVLSNNHVVIESNRFAADIVQPGPLDGGRRVLDRIGQSFQFVPFNLTGPNFMDAAIVRPTTNSLLNPRYLVSASGQLTTLRGHLLSYRVGDNFVKSGRTTGFVSGVVESIGMSFLVGPYRELGNAVLLFRNQTVVRGTVPVSLGGDSGSVWITRTGFAAALNFAGSGTRSISTPIASVLNTFGLRVAAPAAPNAFKPGSVAGSTPKGNFAYARPLTSEQRKYVRVVSAK